MNKTRIPPRLRYGLVGLVIVGLTFIVISVLTPLRERSAFINAMAKAKQIRLALTEYAIDYDGLFPQAGADSNSAYRQLFNERFKDERVFYVPGSAWHNSLPAGAANGPDGEIGLYPSYPRALTVGENHWAYVNGLNNGSKGDLPLVVDGFTETVGVYSHDPKAKGGVHGDRVIIVRADASSMLARPAKNGRVFVDRDGEKIDVFSHEYGVDPADLRNPL